nr:nascent polypeptide-associated complex subunit alpha, muscle-specific form-like [Aegilops tauschii subsp. strangulata]
MSRILGKVVVVIELSLRKEEEVRVKVKCLDSGKLRATIRVFFNDQGFDLRIAPEPPNHVGRPRFADDAPPGGCPGPSDDYHGRHHPRSHRSDDEDGSEDSPSHSPSTAPRPSTSTQGGRPTGRSLAALPEGLLPLLPSSPITEPRWLATLPVSGSSSSQRPHLALLTRWTRLPRPVRRPLLPLLPSSPITEPLASDTSSVGLVVIPASSPRSPDAMDAPPPSGPAAPSPALGSSPVQPEASPPASPRPAGLIPSPAVPEAPAVVPPPASPAVVFDGERPTSLLVQMASPPPPTAFQARVGRDVALAAASPPASPRLPAVSPSTTTTAGCGGTSALATPLAAPPHPPRSTAYARRGRSTSTPVTSSRRSARIDAARPVGSPALPISERAELRAAARNLEPGTPVIPPSSATCSFSALESVPLGTSCQGRVRL